VLEHAPSTLNNQAKEFIPKVKQNLVFYPQFQFQPQMWPLK